MKSAQNKGFTYVHIIWAPPGSGCALGFGVKAGSDVQSIMCSLVWLKYE